MQRPTKRPARAVLTGVRFGVSVAAAPSADAWADCARRAEAGGFDTLLVPDCLDPSMLAPLPAIAMAAATTTTLRFGTMLANIDLRRPVALAQEAATIDLLTGGRFELGLGIGHRRSDYERAGLDSSRASQQVARLAETIEVLRRLWTGEPVWFDGEFCQLHGHSCEVSTTASAIQLLIGGNGWRLLDLAARTADTVGFSGFGGWGPDDRPDPLHFTHAGLAQQHQWVRDAAGPRFDKLELALVVHHVEITSRRREVAAAVRSGLPRLSVDDVLDSPYVLLGSTAQVADSLHDLRERFRISYFVFPEGSWSAAEAVLDSL